MTTRADLFIRQWTEIIARRDHAAVERMIADPVVFYTPRFLKPITDRRHFLAVLQGINTLLPNLAYHRTWTNGDDEAVMEFRGTLGEVVVHGIDIFTIDDQGKIKELTVFLRPLKALSAIGEGEDKFIHTALAKYQGTG